MLNPGRVYQQVNDLRRSVLSVACLLSTVVALEPAYSQASHCDLMVRLVSAMGGPGVKEGQEVSLPAKNLHMSSFVQDASDQLGALPFDDYRPLDRKEARVVKGQSVTFMLRAEGAADYKLSVEPKIISKKRVCLKVDWRERSGRKIVATRLKVANGENVVLGSDEGEHGPMVVLIKPVCK